MPDYLDLSKYMEDPQSDSIKNPYIYDLVAVLRHKGTSAYHGHYIADIKDRETNTWWHFDDENVTLKGDHFRNSQPKDSKTETGQQPNGAKEEKKRKNVQRK